MQVNFQQNTHPHANGYAHSSQPQPQPRPQHQSHIINGTSTNGFNANIMNGLADNKSLIMQRKSHL